MDLDKKDNTHNPNTMVVNFLKEVGIGKENRETKLYNSRIRQITYTLYLFDIIVSSEVIKRKIHQEINELFYNRMIKNKKYHLNNQLLKSIYEYFNKIFLDNVLKEVLSYP